MSKEGLQCDCVVIHSDLVAAVAPQMPSLAQAEQVAHFFKVLGDRTRSRLIWALDQSELCVCDLSVLLKMSKSAVSHQLRVLYDAGFVKNRRDGKVVYYSLDDAHVQDIFEISLSHLREKGSLQP